MPTDGIQSDRSNLGEGVSWARRDAVVAGVIVDNDSMATGMEKKEIEGTADIFWSREPIMGHKGTRENPAIVPSFNTSRVVGLETEQVRSPPAVPS